MSTAHPLCKLCNMNAKFNPEMTNAAIAREFEVSKDSARRHRKHIDSYFTDVPVEQITSRGRTVRLPDGSYEKITYKPVSPSETQDTTAYEDLKGAFDKPAKLKKARAKGVTRVINLADFQVGKGSEYEGAMDHNDTLSRVRASIAQIKALVEVELPEEIILPELGDLIEGFSNTVAQAQTNSIDLTTQIRVSRRLLAEIINDFAPLCKSMHFVSIPSNHSCVRTGIGRGATAATSHNDWGLEISHQLEDILKDRVGFEHVQFHRPPVGEESVVLYSEVSNTTFGFVHGHQKSKPQLLGDWFQGQSHGRRNGIQNVDILLTGHFHSLNVYQSGGRWVIVCPTSDNGSSWFTNLTGEHSVAGILSFTASNQMWSNLNIY